MFHRTLLYTWFIHHSLCSNVLFTNSFTFFILYFLLVWFYALRAAHNAFNLYWGFFFSPKQYYHHGGAHQILHDIDCLLYSWIAKEKEITANEMEYWCNNISCCSNYHLHILCVFPGLTCTGCLMVGISTSLRGHVLFNASKSSKAQSWHWAFVFKNDAAQAIYCKSIQLWGFHYQGLWILREKKHRA